MAHPGPPLIVYVDVDDTLVRSNGGKRIPMVAMVRAVRQLHADGAELYLWSTGGAAYAREMARELQIEGLFQAFLPKPHVMVDDQTPAEWRRLRHIHPAQVGKLSVEECVAALSPR